MPQLQVCDQFHVIPIAGLGRYCMDKLKIRVNVHNGVFASVPTIDLLECSP